MGSPKKQAPSAEKEQNVLLGELTAAIKRVSKYKPGSDLTSFGVSAVLTLPISGVDLSVFGIYTSVTYLLDALESEDPNQRMLCVLRSGVAPSAALLLPGTKKPYNPVLGEVQIALEAIDDPTWSITCEQVSHHPPITAIHLEAKGRNGGSVRAVDVFQTTPIFRGNFLEVTFSGRCSIHLELPDGRVEEYVRMNRPSMCIRGLMMIGRRFTEWSGELRYECIQTKLRGHVKYHPAGFLGLRGISYRISGGVGIVCKGKEPLVLSHTLEGKWNERAVVRTKDGEEMFWEAPEGTPEIFTKIPEPLPYEFPPQSLTWPEHTSNIWGKLSHAILTSNWIEACQAKAQIETLQRAEAAKRAARREKWSPKFWIMRNENDPFSWDFSPRNLAR